MKPIKENEGLNEYVDRMNEKQEEMFLACGIPKKYLTPSGNTTLFIGSEEGAKVIEKYLNNNDTIREE